METRLTALRRVTAVLNPFMRLVAGWAPTLGIVTHVGRRSGRKFRTPVNVFRRGDRYHFALAYGSAVDWLQNVVAAGDCELRTGGRTVRLVEPELMVDPELGALPLPVRLLERAFGVTEVLRMRSGADGGDQVRLG
ncbi:MAG: nitroreductase family deazaflavin-dependent oxidoreductase [Deltaproteobacteria bacterium]|nr:nitroreductase family deazaflavin-dependent oxidoreductase [Deltaproteobacteria bacterium]